MVNLPSAGLDEAEIDRRRKDAEQHASEDKHRRELAEACNQAEHTCYQLEKMIKEHADKLTDADRQPLERTMNKVRDKAKADDVAEIKSALEELEQASHAFSKTIYERARSQAARMPRRA